jgi:hypothetical protein
MIFTSTGIFLSRVAKERKSHLQKTISILLLTFAFSAQLLAGIRAQVSDPPRIITQPQSLTVRIGGMAIFGVDVLSSDPVSYQWLFGGLPLPGETSPLLQVRNVQPTNAGDYNVVITNKAGFVVSNSATLTLPSETSPDTQPPRVTITSPLPGIATTNWVVFSGVVTDNVGIAQLLVGPLFFVQIFEPLNGPFAKLQELNFGTNILSVIASDAAGNETTETVVVILPRRPQSIRLPLPVNLYLSGSPYSLDATADSGLPVTYSVVSGPAVFENNNLILTNTGKVTIRVTQLGDDQFFPVSEERTVNSVAATVSLSLIGSAPLPPPEGHRSARTVFIAGHYAYVGSDHGWSFGPPSFTIFDVSEPTAPRLLADYPDYPQLLALSGEYAFFAADKNLQIMRVAGPAKPELVATYQSDLIRLGQIILSDDIAFLGDGARIEIVDIGNLASPKRLAVLKDAIGPLAVSAGYLYAGYKIFDMSDPGNPAELPGAFGASFVTTTVEDFALTVGYYSSESRLGLRTFDISTRSVPKELGVIDLASYASAIVVAGNYAYVTANCAGFGFCDGLTIFDISQPANPRWAGVYPSRGLTNGLALSGDYLYVAAGTQGLQILKPVPSFENNTPALSIRSGAGPSQLSWPTWARSYRLQWASALSSPQDWKDVDTDPIQTPNEFLLFLNFPERTRFFRLIRP